MEQDSRRERDIAKSRLTSRRCRRIPFRIDGWQPAGYVVAHRKWNICDQHQTPAERRIQRVRPQVGVALRRMVEAFGKREKPQSVHVAIRGIDPALPRRSPGTVRGRSPRLSPAIAEQSTERQWIPAARI